jgi:hypothetical protein
MHGTFVVKPKRKKAKERPPSAVLNESKMQAVSGVTTGLPWRI